MKCVSPKVVLLAVAALAGCSKPKVIEVTPEEPPPVAVATPTPKPRATPATPAPIAKRLAPEGVYFLLRGKSVETSDGITGLKPGTAVMRQPDGSFIANGQKLQLRPDEITNDLEVAGRIAGADAQRQAAIRQTGAAQAAVSAAPASAARPSSGSSAQSSTPELTSSTNSSSTPASSPTSLGTGGLGSTHTMAKDGWLWEKNQNGDWKRVKPLR